MNHAVEVGVPHTCLHVWEFNRGVYLPCVPRNLKRYYGAGDLPFLTFSYYRRLPLLASPRRRDQFLDVLETIRKKYEMVVVGYVVMPEHVQ